MSKTNIDAVPCTNYCNNIPFVQHRSHGMKFSPQILSSLSPIPFFKIPSLALCLQKTGGKYEKPK